MSVVEERPLYGRLMGAIHDSHSFGNSVGMVKLPLLLLDIRLYGGAIAQFYILTRALEGELAKHADHPLVRHVRSGLGLPPLAGGYAADLAQIFGERGWSGAVHQARTRATDDYVAALERAGPIELVAATFILYGALVVGGGKNTQKKVTKVLPGCDHVLFDVADDMQEARRKFKNTFTQIGKDHAGVKAVAPEHADALVEHARNYMKRNNKVVISVRCVPTWIWGACAVVGIGVVAAARLRRR